MAVFQIWSTGKTGHPLRTGPLPTRMIAGRNFFSSAHPVIAPDKEASPQKMAAPHLGDILNRNLLESMSSMRLMDTNNQDPRQPSPGVFTGRGVSPGHLNLSHSFSILTRIGRNLN